MSDNQQGMESSKRNLEDEFDDNGENQEDRYVVCTATVKQDLLSAKPSGIYRKGKELSRNQAGMDGILSGNWSSYS